MGELEKKKQFVDGLVLELQKSKGVFLAESKGIDANSMNALRKRCREGKMRFLTSKNSLSKKAFESAGIKGLDSDLSGPTSMVIAFEDPASPAKILTDFAKGNEEKFKIKSCFVEGKACTPSDVVRLATIPSREVLLSQLLSVIHAPMRNLAGALSGILRNVVNVLDAVAKKKAEAPKPS